MRVGGCGAGGRRGGWPATCILPVPEAAIRHGRAGSRLALGPRTGWRRYRACSNTTLTLSSPSAAFLVHTGSHTHRGVSTTGAPAVSITWDPPSPGELWGAAEKPPPSSPGRGLGSPAQLGLGQGCPWLRPAWGPGGGAPQGHLIDSGLRFLLGSEAHRAGWRRGGGSFLTTPHPALTHAAPTVPVTWARGWWKPCSWGAWCWAPGPGLGLPAGRGASGCGGAAGTGRPGGRRPCGRSRDTAACASSCTAGRRGAAGQASGGLCATGVALPAPPGGAWAKGFLLGD